MSRSSVADSVLDTSALVSWWLLERIGGSRGGLVAADRVTAAAIGYVELRVVR